MFIFPFHLFPSLHPRSHSYSLICLFSRLDKPRRSPRLLSQSQELTRPPNPAPKIHYGPPGNDSAAGGPRAPTRNSYHVMQQKKQEQQKKQQKYRNTRPVPSQIRSGIQSGRPRPQSQPPRTSNQRIQYPAHVPARIQYPPHAVLGNTARRVPQRRPQ